MQIVVEAFSGEASPARRALASRIATEAFSWLSDVVRGVVMRVPAGRTKPGVDLTCSVVVVLRDGHRFDTLATADNVADAIELACHELRRTVAAHAGRPLRRRRDASPSEGVVERRATGTNV